MENNKDFTNAFCPKRQLGTCRGGTLQRIPKQKDAWKCDCCGLEIWDGYIPKLSEIQESIRPPSMKEIMALPGAIKKKGNSRSGKRHKKKIAFQRWYGLGS